MILAEIFISEIIFTNSLSVKVTVSEIELTPIYVPTYNTRMNCLYL